MDYQSYLKLDGLLSQQEPLSEGPEHDELLFIVIHQVYELWFKVMMQEVGSLNQAFDAGDTVTINARLKRMRTVLKTLVSQVDILETMTPLSFSAFRDRLSTSSGFQSLQFRLFEFALGAKNPRYLRFFEGDSSATAKLTGFLEAASVYDHFLGFLRITGYDLPESVGKPVAEPTQPNEMVQDILVKVYREEPILSQICELLVDLDEGLQEWRYRHVKMVERTIGSKMGSGGSSGTEYLKKTLFTPVFPDLWEIRSRL